jgi:hypothetical protein
VNDGKNRFKSLKLTVCCDEDLNSSGLAEQRRQRLWRLMNEAASQGIRLSYRDLSMIMLSSKATLKRDVSLMRSRGIELPKGSSDQGK